VPSTCHPFEVHQQVAESMTYIWIFSIVGQHNSPG
jgi:hypothetical protein